MKTRNGFTLIEVMISVLILAFVVAGISFVLIKQTQASAKQTLERDLEESGRLALLEIGRAVRLAGYGIAPIAAFDFDSYGCTSPGAATPNCNPATVGGITTRYKRDRDDGPDELVISYRDPMFFRPITAKAGAGPYSITISPALTQDLPAGRIVQLLCPGAEPSSYLVLQNAAAAGTTTLTLRVIATAFPADGYYPTAAPVDTCFATASLMLVERVRYYIADDADGVPSLFKERGRGAAELLFRGIEDLQITYDIGQPPAGSAFAAGGASPAANPVGCGGGWTYGVCGAAATPPEAATPPVWRDDPYDSANRYTGHPANIRGVTINIVARSTQLSPDKTTGDTIPAIANRPARAADGYRRAIFTITEQPENLLTRAHFLPLVFTDSNVGGG
jgi:type IV pilus assembly protein PilW